MNTLALVISGHDLRTLVPCFCSPPRFVSISQCSKDEVISLIGKEHSLSSFLVFYMLPIELLSYLVASRNRLQLLHTDAIGFAFNTAPLLFVIVLGMEAHGNNFGLVLYCGRHLPFSNMGNALGKTRHS